VKPTLDGLTAAEWFHVASVLGFTALALACYCWRAIGRALRYVRGVRAMTREDRAAHERWLRERERFSQPGKHYSPQPMSR
jgi:hypothetical protein